MVNFDRRLQHMLTKSRLASVNVCLTTSMSTWKWSRDFDLDVMSMQLQGEVGRDGDSVCS